MVKQQAISNEKRSAAIATALQNQKIRIKGLKVIWSEVPKFRSNLALVAGYNGFDKKNDIKGLFETLKHVLSDWREVVKPDPDSNLTPYGVDGAYPKTQLEEVLRFITRPDQVPAEVQEAIKNGNGLSHDLPNCGRSDRKTRVCFLWIYYAWSIRTVWGVDAQKEPVSPGFLFNTAPDDWMRWMAILEYWKTKGTTRGAFSASGAGIGDEMAIRPLLFSQDEADALSKPRAPEQQIFSDVRELLASRNDTMHLVRDELVTDNKVPLDEELDKHMASNFARTKGDSRPMPTNSEIVETLETLGSRSTIYSPLNFKLDIKALTTGLDTDKATGDIIEIAERTEGMNETETKSFHELRRTMNRNSASPPDFEAAANFLSFILKNRVIKDSAITLFPWQITGLAWLLTKIFSPLQGAVLGDEMGLGKTVTVLSTILAATEIIKSANATATSGGRMATANLPPSWYHMLSLEAVDGRVRYKPTLVVVPNSAVASFKKDARMFKSLTVWYWVGHAGNALPDEKMQTLSSTVEGLIEKLDSLDPEEATTANTVILTTYNTLRLRIGATVGYKFKNILAKLEASEDSDEVNDFDEETLKNKLDEEELEIYYKGLQRNPLAGKFFLRICDEVHLIKNPKTYSAMAVKTLKNGDIPCRFLGMTATSMINRPSDLEGLLDILWNDTMLLDQDDKAATLRITDYRDAIESIHKLNTTFAESTDFFNIQMDKYLFLLHPLSFRRNATGPAGMPLDPLSASLILPPILGQIQIRRTASDIMVVNGAKVSIGSHIPGYKALHIELKMTKLESDMYIGYHGNIIKALMRPGDENNARQDPGVARNLTQLSLDSRLGVVASRIPADATAISSMHAKLAGRTAAIYHLATSAIDAIMPSSRRDMALYMSYYAPKARYLCQIISHICYECREKLIVFCTWPTTLWYLEGLLGEIGVETLTLRAGHTVDQRRATMDCFNDADDTAKVLLCTTIIGSSSWNLQSCCRSVVFADIPTQANIAMQAIGRVWRLGQSRPVVALFLMLDHTFDQHNSYRAASKMISQIAGQVNRVEGEDVGITARGLYARIFGLRLCPDLEVYKDKNPYTKDSLPEEAEYLQEFCTQQQVQIPSSRAESAYWSVDILGM
jgi:hypothetical protein